MSEVAHNAEHEFWRPPAAQAGSTAVEACDGCGSEFLAGARFCHICGHARTAQADSVPRVSWSRYLEFHAIQQGLGLSTAALIAFLLGAGFLLWTIAVGLVYTVQTLGEFQAVQLYRIQGLLAAVAAFTAGILLKKMPAKKE